MMGNIPALGDSDPERAIALYPSIDYEYITNPPPVKVADPIGPDAPIGTGVVANLPPNTTFDPCQFFPPLPTPALPDVSVNCRNLISISERFQVSERRHGVTQKIITQLGEFLKSMRSPRIGTSC
ncbi:MAG: hypothetical protein ACP5D7_00550 [Limnospira sp.]